MSNENKEIPGDYKHGLPKNPVEIISQTKTGTIRIPKEIRTEFKEEQPKFAFWAEGNRFIFHMVTDEDMDKLNIIGKANNKSAGSKKRGSKGKNLDDYASEDGQTEEEEGDLEFNIRKKSSKNLQPELSKYFEFQFENRNEIGTIFEQTFYKLVEDNPNMDECIDRIKYILINYTTGNTSNDSRVFNACINLIADIIQKLPKSHYIELIKFANSKLIGNIHSNFLKEKSLISLLSSYLILQDSNKELEHVFVSLSPTEGDGYGDDVGDGNEDEDESGETEDLIDSGMNYGTRFLIAIIEGIKSYSEIYAIMQGFRNLVSNLTYLDIEIPLSIAELIYVELNNFIEAEQIINDDGDVLFEYQEISTDNKLRFLDFMEDLGLIEKACNVIDKIYENVSEDDPKIEELKEKKRYLHNLQI